MHEIFRHHFAFELERIVERLRQARREVFRFAASNHRDDFRQHRHPSPWQRHDSLGELELDETKAKIDGQTVYVVGYRTHSRSMRHRAS